MWVAFESLTKEERISKKTNEAYECYVMRGTRLGGKDTPDEDYEKILFDTTAVTVIEDGGMEFPNSSAVQFFQYLKPGDVVTLMFSRSNPRQPELYAVQLGKVRKDGTSANMPNSYIPPHLREGQLQDTGGNKTSVPQSGSSPKPTRKPWETEDAEDNIPF